MANKLEPISPALRALSAHLKERRISETRFCADIEISVYSLKTWRMAKHTPSLATAVKIEKYTRGVVPCALWLEDAPPPPSGVSDAG